MVSPLQHCKTIGIYNTNGEPKMNKHLFETIVTTAIVSGSLAFATTTTNSTTSSSTGSKPTNATAQAAPVMPAAPKPAPTMTPAEKPAPVTKPATPAPAMTEKAAPTMPTFSEKDKQELVTLGKDYSKAMEAYFNTEDGKKEFNMRNELRDAFLGLSEKTDAVVEKVRGMGDELDRKVKEWDQKVRLGMMQKKEQKVTMDQFLEKAKAYVVVYNKVSQDPTYKEYFAKYTAFKNKVNALLKSGVKADDITTALRQGGVNNERVLSRPAYWEKKSQGEE